MPESDAPGQVAVFDCFSGIAGDMTVAALAAAGASLDSIAAQLRRLNIPSFRLSLERVQRAGIEASLLHVEIAEERTYQPDELRAHIRTAQFPPRAETRALAAVAALEAGEALAHGTAHPHLHEAGGVDALLDICGAMLALEALDIGDCFCPVVTVGAGAIARAAHGAIPASPGPAALNILQQHAFPMRFVQSGHEMVTPTGAAILAAVAKPAAATLLVSSFGVGAGTFEAEWRPNALRVLIGRAPDEDDVLPALSELAANIDDMDAVLLAEARDQLMRAGALDVWTEPIGMKKGRPATKLCALVRSGEEARFAGIFLRETTTLGVRVTAHTRYEAARSIRPFASSLGTLRVKVNSYDGRSRVTPEFEDVKRLAAEHGMPVLEARRIIETELPRWLESLPGE